MEKKTRIIAVYHQQSNAGYAEDDWSYSEEVTNEKSLFKLMKRLHKTSARTFNNYPFGGLFTPNMINFESQKVIEIDGELYYAERVDANRPDYFEAVAIRFRNWYADMKANLVKRKEEQEALAEQKKEITTLQSLAAKYPDMI